VEHSAFMDRACEPDENELGVLADALPLWSRLVELVCAEFGGTFGEWVHSGRNYGWSFRLKQKKRAIVYLTPLEGRFRVAFALGEKAVAAAQSAGLPDLVLTLIDEAPRYAEGRGVRMLVRDLSDVQTVVALAKIKMAN
jgi:hypothetical protein